MLKKFTVYASTDYRLTEPLAAVELNGDKELVDLLEKELRSKILENYEVE